jgi:hypothetical protein
MLAHTAQFEFLKQFSGIYFFMPTPEQIEGTTAPSSLWGLFSSEMRNALSRSPPLAVRLALAQGRCSVGHADNQLSTE